MRALLLGAAVALTAIALPAAPASAQVTDGQFVGIPDGKADFHNDFGFGQDGRRDGRRLRGSGDVFIGDWPRQGDTAWRSDSFNDWWHDQPHRSFPRWVQKNQDCERMYWAGGAWRC